jgi:E3 ubiquitin-protein ligase UBR2
MDNNFFDDDDNEIEEDMLYDNAVILNAFLPDSSDESNQEEISDDTQGSLDSASIHTFTLSNAQQKLINEFVIEQHFAELSHKAGTGDLLTSLHKHWRLFVPICYNALELPTKNLIETDTQRILFKPLEAYICNSIETDKVLNELKELDDPPQLCGKVFKSGEPSYFCRDCGVDPTCVLCSSCFLKSKHREHRYKMMTSGGGGYCDCGDKEAWRQHPNCELHMPRQNNSSGSELNSESDMNKLPHDVQQRATELFSFLLDYMYEILSIEKSEELPAHLRPEAPADDYITMLYNDEVHSYDQVVGTLKKVLNVDDKKAFEYATIVDKEGRSTIKRGRKADCTQVKFKVEQNMSGPSNIPLETKIMHHSLVSHQYFAERLIVWLEKICEISKGLKHILCKVGIFTKSDNNSVIEKLMISDSLFWKSTRHLIHKFYISVFFMDPNWKKEFAVIYTRNYSLIWHNHVKNPDDYVSLIDLSVQLFTVVSLARYLISHHNLLQIIIDTLIQHCKTSRGKLNFPRGRRAETNEFKRAQFILNDLKYCLIAIPDDWTDDLRRNFINGFKSFVDFIKFLHGMDSIKRYTQQHIEFENDWESILNLLIRVQKFISPLIDWCSSDQRVFIECYKYLLNAIHQSETTDSLFQFEYEKRKFNGTQYEVINFPIMKKEVSMHVPLTRLFAAVYLQTQKFGLNFESIKRLIVESTSSSNPLSTMKHETPCSKMIALIEPSIRVLVLACQTEVGLWKRNGYSLQSQIYFYKNNKFRHEMFERDVLCMQIGASVMNSNEFLIDLLVHYNLYDFFLDESFSANEPTSDDLKLEYLIPISEDFLKLLIQILSERYDPLMSQVDSMQKLEREVIHQLCISPMTHSSLVKNVYSESEKYTNDLELVLSRIATFKSSTSSNSKGVYELKSEYQAYYSPYFYNYDKIEKTKSEEYQLSIRKEEKFFKPPRLPALNNPFVKISHILDSDVFVKMVTTVLNRFKTKSNLASEGQLMSVLHLIGLALYEEQDDVDQNFQADTTNYSFKFLEKSFLNKKSSSSSSSFLSFKSLKSDENNLIKLLNDAILQISNEPYKQLAMWVLNYSKKLLKLKHKIDQQQQKQEEEPSSQARSSSELVEQQEETSQSEKRKNQIAEKKRAKIMAKINKMQKDFIHSYQDLYDETKQVGSSLTTQQMEISSVDESSEFKMDTSESNANVICIGPHQKKSTHEEIATKKYRCILCQEDSEVRVESVPMVLCCYLQGSKVLSKNRSDVIENFDNFDPLFMRSILNWGIDTTSCGHVMHATCWSKYVETVRHSENRRFARYLGFNIKQNEFLCPLCETIGNCVLPLFPDIREFTKSATETHLPTEPSTETKQIFLTYEDWLDGLKKTIENSMTKELQDDKDVFIINPCPLSTITKLMADAVATNFRSLFEFDSTSLLLSSPSAATTSTSTVITNKGKEVKLNTETISIMENFARASYTFGFLVYPNDEDARMPISMWTNCSYTIQVIEQLLRFENKPLFGQLTLKQIDLLANIVKQAALYGMTKNTESVRKSCVRLLAAILPYKTVMFDSKNIMDLDMFYLLVSLCLSMPNLYDQPKLNLIANGGLNDLNVFKLILQAHCVQILVTKLKTKTFFEAADEQSNFKDVEMKAFEFYKYIKKLLGEKGIYKSENESDLVMKTPKIIYSTLKHALMPFLRCSALFFSNLTGLTPTNPITSDQSKLRKSFFTKLYFN